MWKGILQRLLRIPLTLAAVYTLTLALAWAVPGNPVDRPEGKRPSAEVIAAMEARYNLQSFWSFYWSYLDAASGLRWARGGGGGEAGSGGGGGSGRPVFDLGPSLQYRDRDVNEIIRTSLPISALVGATAMVMALGLGLGAGVLGMMGRSGGRGGAIDSITLLIALIGISVPTFVVGTLLQLLFAVWLPVTEVGRFELPGSLWLPALTLSLPFAAYIARLTRMGMIEAMASDYVRTARAKGVSELGVLVGHALPNAFLPVLSYLGPATAMAMTGSFVVERIFSVPGMGQHFVNAVQNKDLFLLLGIVLVFSTLMILMNVAVDVLYRWVDPRVRG